MSGATRRAPSESIARLFVALFFTALTLVGLLTAGDYGLGCDEPAERVILMENLHEYAVRFGGAQSEAARYYEAKGINRISQSIERDHGECAYYPFAPLITRYESRPDIVMRLYHSYTWLLFMLGVVSLYGLTRLLGVSRPISCIAALLFVLCPRFFAEGHYNNKDIVLLSLTLTTLLTGARLTEKPTAPRALLFAFVGAMAANTKVAGVFAWALMGLCAIVRVSARREWNRRAISAALCALLGFAAFYAALTPALLADPAGYLGYTVSNAAGFTRWTGVVIFRGARYEPAVSALPRSYLPYMMLVTLPLYVPPLCALGQVCGLKQGLQKDALKSTPSLTLCALTLMWLVPLAFVIWRQPVMYNGWRHFYFIFAGLAPLMALGLQALWRFACRIGRPARAIAALGCAALIGFQAVTLATNHPYQYAYYNPLARATAQTDMELDYWDVSTLNAMRKLLEAERDETLPLRLGAREYMSLFGITHAYEVLSADEKARLAVTDEGDAPYLFSNTTYALIYGISPPEGYREIVSIASYGNTLCTVYERMAGE